MGEIKSTNYHYMLMFSSLFDLVFWRDCILEKNIFNRRLRLNRSYVNFVSLLRVSWSRIRMKFRTINLPSRWRLIDIYHFHQLTCWGPSLHNTAFSIQHWQWYECCHWISFTGMISPNTYSTTLSSRKPTSYVYLWQATNCAVS